MREVIAGDKLDQYKLTELLARSGMASIFKAIDERSGREVALKVPHMQFESDVSFYQRFKREEQIGQKLEHPNIVRVLGPEKKSRVYLVMEYAEGKSLRALMGARKRLPTEEALDITRQIARALVYLHEKGIVHRDLKPDNVMITPGGDVKLLDFGIAMDEAARRLTWFGLSPPVGTPDYMAPEQVRGKRGDARTDVYALGTLLYEMLTGEVPFVAANSHALMRAKLDRDPRPAHEVVPDIDPKLEEIVMRAIDRQPRERYHSAQEMLTDLEDPSQVVLQRRMEREDKPLLARLRLPPRVLGPAVTLAVLGVLLILTWLMSRSR
jgi:serine/threonine protein kinase